MGSVIQPIRDDLTSFLRQKQHNGAQREGTEDPGRQRTRSKDLVAHRGIDNCGKQRQLDDNSPEDHRVAEPAAPCRAQSIRPAGKDIRHLGQYDTREGHGRGLLI